MTINTTNDGQIESQMKQPCIIPTSFATYTQSPIINKPIKILENQKEKKKKERRPKSTEGGENARRCN